MTTLSKNTLWHNKVVRLMGNQFEIGLVTPNNRLATEAVEAAIAEIKRIETLFTTYSTDSITQQINANAGIRATQVPDEFYQLVYRSLNISKITQGAFDLSYGGINSDLWNFNTNMTKIPSIEEAKKSIFLVNYQNIELNASNQTIFLKEKGMKIGFGGIGKGYAADRAKYIMQSMGVENGLVNASGDIAAWGHSPSNTPWNIGIVNPNLKEHLFSSIPIDNMAIATSGNYEKYVVIDGKKYSHTIDPRSGLPIRGIKSVTTISHYAEFCDAMTKPIMIMGAEKGLFMVNQIKGLECIIIDDDNHIFLSNNIKYT